MTSLTSEQLLVLLLRLLCSLVGNRDLSYVLQFKGIDLLFQNTQVHVNVLCNCLHQHRGNVTVNIACQLWLNDTQCLSKQNDVKGHRPHTFFEGLLGPIFKKLQ